MAWFTVDTDDTVYQYTYVNGRVTSLTFIVLTSTKWRAPASASKWRMGFNSEFIGLTSIFRNVQLYAYSIAIFSV
jgi:hypothetical protein